MKTKRGLEVEWRLTAAGNSPEGQRRGDRLAQQQVVVGRELEGSEHTRQAQNDEDLNWKFLVSLVYMTHIIDHLPTDQCSSAA